MPSKKAGERHPQLRDSKWEKKRGRTSSSSSRILVLHSGARVKKKGTRKSLLIKEQREIDRARATGRGEKKAKMYPVWERMELWFREMKEDGENLR